MVIAKTLQARMPLLTARFYTIGYSILVGLGLAAFLGKAVVIFYEVFYGQKIYMSGYSSFVTVAAVWLFLTYSTYQVWCSTTLDSAGKCAQRRYTLFGVIIFRHVVELSTMTWVQAKTAYVGSNKFVIDVGSAAGMNKTHFIEMPPQATWDETVLLGKFIAEALDLECRPYIDKISGVDSTSYF